MRQPELHSPKRFLRPVTYGLLFGAAASFLLLLGVSMLMTLRDLPQTAVALTATLTFLIGGFVSGYSSAMFAREKGLLLGICCGLVLFMVLTLCSLAFDSSGFGLQCAAKLIAVLLAAMLGGVLGVNKKRKFK